MLGMFSKWSPETGWVKTTANDPEGSPDLNTFHSMGLPQIFFVKPTKDIGTERYESKQTKKAIKDTED
jgi:thiol:disulfide interchange protein